MNTHLSTIAAIAAENSGVYGPLPGPDAIRLVTIEAGLHNAPISCNLQVQDKLCDAPAYQALSYCWGGANITETIDCNGSTFVVAKNVSDVLKTLRRPDRSITLWVDAICINQHDVLERNRQVLIMKSIYTRATRVNVWLGATDTQSKVPNAAKSVRQLAYEICRHNYGPGEHDTWMQRLMTESDFSALVDVPSLTGSSHDRWPQLSAFFACEWFRRIWVVQEVQSCCDTWLLYGYNSIEWPLVALVVRWITCDRHLVPTGEKMDPDHRRSWHWQANPHADFMVDPVAQTDMHVPFLWVLYRTRCFEATDPRDKIFAMLRHPVSKVASDVSHGMTIDNHLDIRPDYTKTAQEVFNEVAVQSIRHSKRLEILSYYWFDQPLTYSGHDWVPRWDLDCSRKMDTVPPWMYQASGAYLADPPSKDGRLQVRGLLLGRIGSLHTLLALRDPSDNSDAHRTSCAYADSLQSIARIAVHDRYTESRDGQSRTWSDTLCKNKSRDAQHMADFAAWLLPRITDEIDSERLYFSSNAIWCSECADNILNVETGQPTPSAVLGCNICGGGQCDLCASCYERGVRCDDNKHTVHQRIQRGLWLPRASLDIEDLSLKAEGGDACQFAAMLRLTTRARMWFTLSSGLIGSGSLGIQADDYVAVLFGASVPFVLRQQACGRYRLVGDCYVDGMMDGQAIDKWQRGELDLSSFELA